jgi:hypothetical protein
VKDKRLALSALWVFMVLNYLYCDVISLFDPAVLKDAVGLTSSAGAIVMTPTMLFASAVLMEIPIAMVLLSRVLPFRANRWANVVAPGFLVLVQVGSLFVGTSTAHYIFFSVIEIGTLLLIAALSLRWTAEERTPVAA